MPLNVFLENVLEYMENEIILNQNINHFINHILFRLTYF